MNQWSRTLAGKLALLFYGQPQDESLDPIDVYNNMKNHPTHLDCASKAFQLGSSSVLWLSPSAPGTFWAGLNAAASSYRW